MQRYNKIFKYFFIAFITLGAISQAWAMTKPLELMGARLSQVGDTTRIVFEFSHAFQFHLFSLANPNRTVLDLPKVMLATNLKQLPFHNSVIKDVRDGHYKQNTLRIVFDLKNEARTKAFVLKPSGEYGYRLVLDIIGKSASKPLKKKEVTKKPTVVNTPDLNLKKQTKIRNIIIVIDPGHGGKDPGATGPRGIHEKNVVLKISKDIARDVDRIPGLTAKLTRDGDYYITLRDRLRIARKDHADFFVAIHADAYPNDQAKGASIFALSRRGATSEAARWLAEKENHSELGGIYLANKSRVLRSVLIDLSQTATISQSLNIGRTILGKMEKITPMHSYKVEQARFVVLKSPDIPSLLIETGFISNLLEEKRLNSSWYQMKLAKAITSGIKTYFWQHPLSHTLIALEKNSKKYTVSRGDSLSIIASKYHTTISLLKRLNRLKSPNLRIGQILFVPRITITENKTYDHRNS